MAKALYPVESTAFILLGEGIDIIDSVPVYNIYGEGNVNYRQLVGLRLICRHNLRNNRYHFIRELFQNNRSLVSIRFIKRSSAHAIDYSAY